ncbi:tail fiber domain-containing protein [Ruminiclostridium herbifermentans]|uniref:Tail fiber domain-containing protein n=2 Tax=Ruminiclostridium herbifermentans TaxID=2488810 RepID=A0A4U7JIA7_9FIRM|nr:tail fiber domain-containing protein [Ruminiclostridium herbifermentans]
MCKVIVSGGLALNCVKSTENDGEMISQQIYIYDGHPDSVIDLSECPAFEDIYIYVRYKEEERDYVNEEVDIRNLTSSDLEKGKAQEIHIYERGIISYSTDKPLNIRDNGTDEIKDIILARVKLEIDEKTGYKYIKIVSEYDFDDKTPVRTYSKPAGKTIASQKILFKMSDDAGDMPSIRGIFQEDNSIGLEVDAVNTYFDGSVQVNGDLVVYGNIKNDSSREKELLISNRFVQVNSYSDEWKLQNSGLQVYRGESKEKPDACLMWSEEQQKWQVGYKYKEEGSDEEIDEGFYNLAYGPEWEKLINGSVIDEYHKHTKLYFPSENEAIETDNLGKLSIHGNISLNDNTIWLRSKENAYHGLGWFGIDKTFANLAIDGPALFGLKGGILGTTDGGQKAIISWNSRGNVGIGVPCPVDDKLELAGSLRILSSTNPIKFSSKWTGFPDSTTNCAEICNDTTNHKALMIVGNKSAGQGRKVAIWDRLDVNGTLNVKGDMQLSQALRPSTGKTANNGIIFPNDPGGGSGDAAWIRYYARTGEACTLEIGTSNDADDHIALMASGNVGIGTLNPADDLDVNGYMRIMSGSNPIRFTSKWSGFPDMGKNNYAEICNDTTNFKSLMIAGNRSAGGVRKISIWDTLEVKGSLKVNGNFKTLCAITPSVGKGENNGITFPRDYYGGTGDSAWIRYYSDTARGGGENMTLEIGISNDVGTGGYYGGGDRIRLYASGGVYVDGYLYYSSSRTLKENINRLSAQKAKNILEGLNPVSFNFKGDKEKRTLGFIAEEVPSEVATNDHKAISPMEIITVLTSVVKEQRKLLKTLQKQVEELSKQ